MTYLLPPFTLPRDNEVKIVVGDALAMLKMVPSNSIHCVVTSPPYWGLRDYGTAEWRGGDLECQHRIGNQVTDSKWSDGQIVAGVRPGVDATRCLDCGAIRQDKQLGLEPTPDEYVANMVRVFQQVRRVLREDGNCFVNIGDSYMKDKNLSLVPFQLALALRVDGWIVRQVNIWHKPNCMPESVKDRTTTAHEYVFHLTKAARYYYDADAIREEFHTESNVRNKRDETWTQGALLTPVLEGTREWNTNGGKNKRSVWTIATRAYPDAHFAVFPPDLAELCIKCGCPENGIVLDCFGGAGTTGLVASRHNRRALLMELNPDYAQLAHQRIYNDAPLFNLVEVA